MREREIRQDKATHQFQTLPVAIGSRIVDAIVAFLVSERWVGVILKEKLEASVSVGMRLFQKTSLDQKRQ